MQFKDFLMDIFCHVIVLGFVCLFSACVHSAVFSVVNFFLPIIQLLDTGS